MKNIAYFKVFSKYMKEVKWKLILFIVLVVLSYVPSLLSVYLWGLAIEYLVLYNSFKFLLFLILYEAVHLFFFVFLRLPREALYNYIEIHFIKSVSKDLYRKIDMLPAIAFEDMGVGEFVNRLSSDVERILELMSKLINLACRAVIVIIVIIIACQISWLLLLEIVILGIIMGFLSNYYYPKIKKSQEEIKKQNDQYIKIATESITGIREIKALGITAMIENKISKLLDSMYSKHADISKSERYYYSLCNFAYFVMQFVILLTTGNIFIKGIIPFSLFVVMENCIWRVDDLVENISDFGVSYNKIVVSLKRIDEILNNRLYLDEHYGKEKLVNPKGTITFDSVSFRYREKEANTLNSLSMKIEANKKTAIVGRSGNGKSTIFNLLLRYFDASEGQILIDEVPIEELSRKSLRKNISVISQSPFLFNMSVIDNFRIVKSGVTLEEVREVCKKAYIDDYIMSLDDGYDTIIGEGGVNLSGGQKQRIAIARTLLLNTKIILFDEATSALDNESQEYIKKTIDNLASNHTIVIVAHRLSTIIDADVIHVIDKGRLAGIGTHQELLKKNKIYQNLYQKEEL
ncbi:MAG: ABC transporter ATP-binding protein [Bacilli bacterium]|nr:ABC transporter ATP-binding protein [Bacilli bacterium]